MSPLGKISEKQANNLVFDRILSKHASYSYDVDPVQAVSSRLDRRHNLPVPMFPIWSDPQELVVRSSGVPGKGVPTLSETARRRGVAFTIHVRTFKNDVEPRNMWGYESTFKWGQGSHCVGPYAPISTSPRLYQDGDNRVVPLCVSSQVTAVTSPPPSSLRLGVNALCRQPSLMRDGGC
ncbi:hypothetical protein B0H14DRAFT_2591233 [Mycena olivaceomarginata]|nr:hypothetical protein B0H14DRAFT_2591233 [Mycena olivaceomarginata]